MEPNDLTKELQDKVIILKPEDIELGEVCAIKATNRQVLIDAINQYVNSSFFDGQGDTPYLHLEIAIKQQGCEGCSVDYKTEADIPYHSVPCTCGNPNHWLIKYEEEVKDEAVHS